MSMVNVSRIISPRQTLTKHSLWQIKDYQNQLCQFLQEYLKQKLYKMTILLKVKGT